MRRVQLVERLVVDDGDQRSRMVEVIPMLDGVIIMVLLRRIDCCCSAVSSSGLLWQLKLYNYVHATVPQNRLVPQHTHFQCVM